MAEQYEHFDRLIESSHRRDFYVSTRGYVYAIDRFTGRRIDYRLGLHFGQLRAPIRTKKFGNHPSMKKLVWFTAKNEIIDPKKYCLMPKDGNEEHVNIENLEKVPAHDIHLRTGRMVRKCTGLPVTVKEYGKEPVQYGSVREAAAALYCSYQTLSDYLNGTNAHRQRSVLKKWGRKIYYTEENRK